VQTALTATDPLTARSTARSTRWPARLWSARIRARRLNPTRMMQRSAEFRCSAPSWAGADSCWSDGSKSSSCVSLLTIAPLSRFAVNYLDLPRLLGFNQYPIVLQFSDASGLYPSARVTYRAFRWGK